MAFDDTTSEPAIRVGTSDKLLMILCHLSPFIGLPFLLPFVVWLVKKSETDAVSSHAAEAFNFHLSYAVYALLCVPLTFIFIGGPLLVIIGVASLVLAVIGAVRAADGILYRYPLTFRLLSER
jgi:uncharacterized protein